MAKIAAAGPFPRANNVQFGGGGSKVTTTTLKRKTPSELRVIFFAKLLPQCCRYFDIQLLVFLFLFFGVL